MNPPTPPAPSAVLSAERREEIRHRAESEWYTSPNAAGDVTALLRELNRLSAQKPDWNISTPEVAPGTMDYFWCRTKTGRCRTLCYGNAFVMPLSDTCDEPPENAVAVGEDGDYAWTGWWEESCEQCDTYWSVDTAAVVAWIKMPTIQKPGDGNTTLKGGDAKMPQFDPNNPNGPFGPGTGTTGPGDGNASPTGAKSQTALDVAREILTCQADPEITAALIQQFADQQTAGWKHQSQVNAQAADNWRNQCAILEASLATLQAQRDNLCEDWAEDDAFIRKMCAKRGVNTDGAQQDGFKTMVDCVEDLAAKYDVQAASLAKAEGKE